MPIISAIGRRSPRVRLLFLAIYAVLGVGALAMVYPFGLMIAGSTRSAVDAAESRLIPSYLTDELALYRKHVEGLFNESLVACRAAYPGDFANFDRLPPPPEPNRRLVAAWEDFLRTAPPPPHAFTVGHLYTPLSRGAIPSGLRALRAGLQTKFGGDLDALNRAMGTEIPGWPAFYVLPEDFLSRRTTVGDEPIDREVRAFKVTRPLAERYYFCAEGFFKSGFLQTQYSRDIAAYNRSHGTSYPSWDAVHLDRSLPSGPGRTAAERRDWEEFMRSLVNLYWVRADPDAAPSYRAFLLAKYGSIEALNRNHGTQYATAQDIPPAAEAPSAGLARSDWQAFLEGWRDPATDVVHRIPAESLRAHGVEFLFRDFLRERFGALAAANAALGTACGDWLEFLPPQRDLHTLDFRAHRGALRRAFTVRNYLSVADYILIHGRAILNTAIYCLLAVLAALVVNPLAAYALSRYRPPATGKLLLFLMLTMAFPPMVTQIPVFLMLREFHLLNSYWALLLPGLANGYSVFLLKGFFDSLPRELYECAAIDGAGELRIFLQITMALSKPILAVITLGAFTAAYSNFAMALLICQDPRMWTLMPWLYQLQQTSHSGVIFASLLCASLPTFLIFAFCQKIIMRGIVLPVEK